MSLVRNLGGLCLALCMGLVVLGCDKENAPKPIDPNDRVKQLETENGNLRAENVKFREENSALKVRVADLEAMQRVEPAQFYAGWQANLALQEGRLVSLAKELNEREATWRDNVSRYNARLAFAESAEERIRKAEEDRDHADAERRTTQGIVLWFVVLGIPLIFLGLVVAVAWLLSRIRGTHVLTRELIEEVKPALLSAPSNRQLTGPEPSN